MDSPRVSLPRPHNNVSVEVHFRDWGIEASYIGRPDDMIAAGCAEPDMFLLAPRTGVKRYDSNGIHFSRFKRPNGRFEIQRHLEGVSATEWPRLPGINAADYAVWCAERALLLTRGRGNFSGEDVVKLMEKTLVRASRPHLRLVVNNDVEQRP